MNFLKNGFNYKPFSLVYPTDKTKCKNVLLIDKNVKGAKLFANSVNDATFPIIYSNTSTKTEMLDLLQTLFTDIERIGIVFTSNLGHINSFLDCKPLFANNETYSFIPYSENVEFILSIIKEFNVQNIDYLACNTLNCTKWTNYYDIITKETGVIVGASNDKTGNIKYGGDWIMESTMQDIEFIYFTQSIKCYSYLLDNPPFVWASGLNSPVGLIAYGQYMYVANLYDNTISKIEITSNENSGTIIPNWVQTNNDSPFGLAIYGPYMYVSYDASNKISQIRLADGVVITDDWVPIINTNSYGLVIQDQYMYVANPNTQSISKIQIKDNGDAGTIISNWAINLNSPFGLVIYGQYIYTSNAQGFSISQISLATGAIVNLNWATGFNFPMGLVTYGQYMYVANTDYGSGTTVSQIKIADNGDADTIVLNWAKTPSGSPPVGLLVYGQYIYVATFFGNTILRFKLPPLPPLPLLPPTLPKFRKGSNSYGQFWFGGSSFPGFLYKKNMGVGTRRSTQFTPGGTCITNQPNEFWNKYTPGAGVGASSIATRRSKMIHATSCNNTKQCGKFYVELGQNQIRPSQYTNYR